MIEIEGTIVEIANENNNGRDKKVMTLNAGRNNILFIEFQGRMTEEADKFKADQHVKIRIRFNGKVSKLGRRYNNLIAKSIQKTNGRNN